MVKTVVSGAAGRMGKAIIRGLSGTEGILLTGALEEKGHPSLKEDAGQIAGVGRANVPLTTELVPLLQDADVLIDFTTPKAALRSIETCAETGVAAVVGTTGFSPEEAEAFTIFAQRTRTVSAPNMSVGVNLLFKLAEMAALSLGDAYDVEIVEAHHRLKKDAPSGTALRLGEIL
ncbi:4-hydroxy-tetrahydrodipicolinate reductase, partial [bacterium]